MPRLRQVHRREITDQVLLSVFDQLFQGKDPIENPGASNGTIGSWWTVHALSPSLARVFRLRHEWIFGARELPARLRELACARVGWNLESRFVFNQYCRALRVSGVTVEQIFAIPHWSSSDCFDSGESAVLGYADDLSLGSGRTTDQRIAHLRQSLSDVAILELTDIICTFCGTGRVSKALRLELDDHRDPIVEIE